MLSSSWRLLSRGIRITPWRQCSHCSKTPFSATSVAGLQNDLAHRYASTTSAKKQPTGQQQQQERLSKIISTATNVTLSRREAERLIRSGEVTYAGQVVHQPHMFLRASETVSTIRVKGKLIQPAPIITGSTADNNNSNTITTRVWLVHKLAGELVADFDPHSRPLLMDRLKRAGVGRKGKQQQHIKPVGRLDSNTEGLIVVTNDGEYARDMELPVNALHRTYRVRVHGLLQPYKIQRIERGLTIDGARYRGMRVNIDKARRSKVSSTNQWITLTCTEGKNRQVRNVLQYLGLKVTRLIRTSYGDYQLQTIPPGMAIEVPVKPVEKQKHRGPLWKKPTRQSVANPSSDTKNGPVEERARPVQWIRHR